MVSGEGGRAALAGTIGLRRAHDGLSYQGRHMSWVLLVGAAWLVLALAAAVLIGRSVRLADRKAAGREAAPASRRSAPVDVAAAQRSAHRRARSERPGQISTARSA
jgi:hypothetical protein